MIHKILNLDFLPMLIAAVVGYAIGAIWYSPLLFGKAWRAEVRLTDEEWKSQGGVAKKMLGTFICVLLASVMLDVLVSDYRSVTVQSGCKFGFFVGAFLVGALHLPNTLYENRSCKYFLITSGYTLVLCVVECGILAIWR
jgi:hypothetical protein